MKWKTSKLFEDYEWYKQTVSLTLSWKSWDETMISGCSRFYKT